MVYQVTFGVLRRFWGRWYGQESEQEALLRGRLQSMGEEGHESVRVTLQKQERGDPEAEAARRQAWRS